MNTSNVTIKSSKVSDVSRSSKSISVTSRSKFAKKNFQTEQDVPLDMAELQEEN